jgi:succinoglycan biosynthesis transport protein ExoP
MTAPSATVTEYDDAGQGASLDRLRAAWSRRKGLAVLLFAVPFTAALTLVLSLPNVYRSTATVLIERQQVPEEFVRSTVTNELETRLTAMSQDVLDRPRLEALITHFGLYPDLREHGTLEPAVRRMRSDVQLDLKESTEQRGRPSTTIAFSLSYRGRDPQTVALITNSLASSYVEENLRARERQAADTTEFLRTQLTATKQRLDEQERRVSALRARYRGELPQQQQGNLATLESLTTQLRLNNDNEVRLAERRESLTAQLAQARAESGGPEPDEVRLARYKAELGGLRIKYTDRWPDIIRLKDEIGRLEKQLAEPKPKPDPKAEVVPATPRVFQLQEALKSAETELRLLKADDGRLRNALDSYQTRIENAPKRELEFAEVTRDYDTTKELYQTLLKRYGEAQIAVHLEQRLKGEQFRLLDPALPASTPAAPNRLKLLLLSLALSVGLAVGGLVLAEIRDTSFHSVDALRAFSTVPVLVAIPQIVTEADVRKRRTRFRLVLGGAVLGLLLTAGVSYFIAHDNQQLTNLLSPSTSALRS